MPRTVTIAAPSPSAARRFGACRIGASRIGTCWIAAACMLVAAQSGCTSALTTVALRDGLWDAAESTEPAADGGVAGSADAAPEPDAPAPSPEADESAERERREAALEEAMSRLSRLGPLDPAVEASLVATLQRTQPEDWPVVVEEFSATLAAAAPPPAPAELPAAASAAVEAPRPSEPEPVTTTSAAPPTASAEEPEAAVADPPAAEPAVEPARTPLAVRTACFASAVRAWGDVERFDSDRFRPGQEVIVYVELDHLSAGDSPAGHTTCVDAVLRLVDAAGRPVHTWTFDPVAETCVARRRDYFARYVVRIPDSAPAGGCRVEVDVTDTLAGATASTALPLEVAASE